MVLKRKNSLRQICNTLVRPGLMLRNKSDDTPDLPPAPSPPPGLDSTSSKSNEKEVLLRGRRLFTFMFVLYSSRIRNMKVQARKVRHHKIRKKGKRNQIDLKIISRPELWYPGWVRGPRDNRIKSGQVLQLCPTTLALEMRTGLNLGSELKLSRKSSLILCLYTGPYSARLVEGYFV